MDLQGEQKYAIALDYNVVVQHWYCNDSDADVVELVALC